MIRDLTSKAKKRVRKELSNKYGWFCHYCGMKLIPDDKRNDTNYVDVVIGGISPKPGYDFPEIDHLTPRIGGGNNSIENLVLSCGKCNHTKNRKTETEYLEWRDK